MQQLLNSELAKTLAWLVILMFVEYAGVFVAILADLRSGTLKARREGVKRTSSGYRRTVEKAGRYYIALIALSVTDAMLVVSALFLQATTGLGIPPFPVFTTLGAVGIALIEVKSICENSHDPDELDSIKKTLKRLLDHPLLREFARSKPAR